MSNKVKKESPNYEMARTYLDYLHPDPFKGMICPQGYQEIYHREIVGCAHPGELDYEYECEGSRWPGSVGDFGVDGEKEWLVSNFGKTLEPKDPKSNRSAYIEQVSLNAFKEIVQSSNGKAEDSCGLKNILIDFDGQETNDKVEILTSFLKRIELPFSFAVYSGSKGVHVVICLSNLISDPALADRVCKSIYEILKAAGGNEYGLDAGPLHGGRKYTSAVRLPGLNRQETKKMQELVVAWQGYITNETLFHWLTKKLPNWETRKRFALSKDKKTSKSLPDGEQPDVFAAMLKYAEENKWIYMEEHFWEWVEPSHFRKLEWKDKSESKPETNATTKLWEVYRKEVGTDVSHRRFKDFMQSLSVERSASVGHHPNLVNFANGVVDLDTGQLLPRSEKHKFNYVIPVNFSEDLLKNPLLSVAWARIVSQHVPASEDQELLESFIGYSMTDDRTKHQMLVLYGAPDTGKGKVLGFVGRLLGQELVARESIAGVLDEPAVAANLIGKRVSIATEARFRLSDMERFKALVSFEGVLVHVYYIGKTTIENGCKFLCSTNDEGWMPNSPEIQKRVRVVNFVNSVAPAEQDPHLDDKLWEDRTIIVHRCLAAYLKHRQAASFLLNESTRKYLRVASENINPVAAWIHDEGIESGDFWYPNEFLLSRYRQHTGDEKITGAEFGKKMTEAGLKCRDHDGDRRSYPFYSELRVRRGRYINKSLDKEFAAWAGQTSIPVAIPMGVPKYR